MICKNVVEINSMGQFHQQCRHRLYMARFSATQLQFLQILSVHNLYHLAYQIDHFSELYTNFALRSLPGAKKQCKSMAKKTNVNTDKIHYRLKRGEQEAWHLTKCSKVSLLIWLTDWLVIDWQNIFRSRISFFSQVISKD